MNLDSKFQPIIKKSRISRIAETDFDNINFGGSFTDHMLTCDYFDGEWDTPVIKPYEPFLIDPSAKVFHYGQAIFEGMKSYRDQDGGVWLFRPDENHRRFNKSAVRMAMPEIPETIFLGGIRELLKLDREWVRPGQGNSLYIRPFMIALGTGVMAAPSTHYRFMIILSPARAYYSGEVKVIIAEHFSRAANGGIGAAKAAGNYSAQFYPTKLANDAGYQQIIWTDDATHTKLEEAGTMNVFFRIGDKLLTAPASERILDGITRKSVIQIAQDEQITVEQRPVLVTELLRAAAEGTLVEIFGTGTAAVVTPIAGFSYRDRYFELPTPSDPYATRFKKILTDLQYGDIPDPYNWRLRVC